jgi:hypothetical protein
VRRLRLRRVGQAPQLHPLFLFRKARFLCLKALFLRGLGGRPQALLLLLLRFLPAAPAHFPAGRSALYEITPNEKERPAGK